MIPECLKLNKFVYTRIPRPYELFSLSGFKSVVNESLYTGDEVSRPLSKIDAIASELDKISSSEDLPEG